MVCVPEKWFSWNFGDSLPQSIVTVSNYSSHFGMGASVRLPRNRSGRRWRHAYILFAWGGGCVEKLGFQVVGLPRQV